MESQINDLQHFVDGLKEDLAKFEEGNKAAGTRARQKCQQIKQLAQAIRVEVQERKNAG